MNDSAIAYIQNLCRDPYPITDYRVATPDLLLSHFFFESNQDSPLACDTESLPDGTPYCVTVSEVPGTSLLIYCDNDECMEMLREAITNSNLLVFHNYLHDAVIFDYLRLPINHFHDTMLTAYNLCLGGGGDEDEGMAGRGSLGLKQLAYRYLNVTMTSFKDTVYPHSIPRLRSYLQETLALVQPVEFTPTCQCGHLIEAHERRGKTQRPSGKCGLCDGCKRSKLRETPPTTEEDRLLGYFRRKIENLLRDTEFVRDVDYDEVDDSGENSVDPWKRIKGWHPHDHDFLSAISGPVPRPSIADVPEPELLRYAGADADISLRLHLYLEQMVAEGGRWLFY